MKNGLIILGILAITLAAPACKKLGMSTGGSDEGDSKTYLVDDHNDTTPDQSPCLGKGAVGLQGLLLKADCPKITPPPTGAVCGNHVVEAGEECDETSAKCDIKTCKAIATNDDGNAGGPTGDGGKEAKINTSGNSNIKFSADPDYADGDLGKDYSVYFKLSGGKDGQSYHAEVTNLPEGQFEYSVQKDWLIIESKGVTKIAGTYKPHVKVWLDSNTSDSAICPETVCQFKINDHLAIKAYDLKDVLYSIEWLFENKSPFCSTSQTDNAKTCGPYELKSDSMMGTYNANYNTGKGAYMFIVLRSSGLKSDDKSFKWSLSVDGKVLSDADVSTDDFFECAKGKKTCPTGLFLLDYKHDKVVDADTRFLVISASAFKPNSPTEYKNVAVTVSNASGASQKIVFDKVTIPSITSVNDFIASEKEKVNAKYAACHNMKVESITSQGKVYTSDAQGVFVIQETLPVISSGDAKPSSENISINVVGGEGTKKLSDIQFSTQSGEFKTVKNDGTTVLQWPAYQKLTSTNGTLSDSVTLTVSDSSSECVQKKKITIKRQLTYPFDTVSIAAGNIVVSTHLCFDYVDGDTQFKVELQDKNGTTIASNESGFMNNNAYEGGCFDQGILMTAGAGKKLSDIARIALTLKDDPWAWNDMEVSKVNFSISTKYWHTKVLKDSIYDCDYSGNLGTCFGVKDHVGSIYYYSGDNGSNGEVDGNSEVWIFAVPKGAWVPQQDVKF